MRVRGVTFELFVSEIIAGITGRRTAEGNPSLREAEIGARSGPRKDPTLGHLATGNGTKGAGRPRLRSPGYHGPRLLLVQLQQDRKKKDAPEGATLPIPARISKTRVSAEVVTFTILANPGGSSE